MREPPNSAERRPFGTFGFVRLLAVLMLTVPHFVDGRMPQGYYILLRWVVCPILGLLAYKASQVKSVPWMWIFGLTAAIFNPIFLARLGEMWPPLDFVTAGLLVVSLFLKLELPDGSVPPR